MASAAGTRSLIYEILPERMATIPYPAVEEAKLAWNGNLNLPSPADTKQKAWDTPLVQATYNNHLLEKAADTKCQARLLAVSAKETGAWFNALPISSLGLWMDDDVIRIAAGHRLGIPICHPHQCHHCKATVGELGFYELSCFKNEGRLSHHAAINSIIQRSLMVAGISSILEPAGLSRSDGQRSDGVTIAPWKSGRHLSGMSHVLAHLQPHMRYRQHQKQELLQLWQSGKRRSNMRL